jgi:hypothetical protein
MKLLYSGASQCDEATFKRLLLVASDLAFMDRPSIMFGKQGTIGHDSVFRRIDTTNSPVKIEVHSPLEGQDTEIYQEYARADFENTDFSRIVLDGFKNDDAFAAKFIQPHANYGEGVTGRLIREAFARAGDLAPIPFAEEVDPRQIFRIDTTHALRSTLRTIMFDVSVQVTSALLVAECAEASPVANDPYLLQLISQRTSGNKYVGSSSPHAWLVGMEFAKAAIPDEALQRLSVSEILSYREKTLAQYQAWSVDLNQIAAKIDDLTVAEAHDRIPRLIASELVPKLTAYSADMTSARDDLFAGLMKGIINLKPPALSLASFAALGYEAAIVAFASSIAISSSASLIDYMNTRRKTKRKHAISYLVGISPGRDRGRAN